MSTVCFPPERRETGKKMRADVIAKIEKWQEPPPAKTVKPLPAPDFEVKKKRGGKRHRLAKERYGMTEIRKQQNRINFNIPEEEIGFTGEGMGSIGQGGSGKIRVNAGSSKKLQKDAQKARLVLHLAEIERVVRQLCGVSACVQWAPGTSLCAFPLAFQGIKPLCDGSPTPLL